MKRLFGVKKEKPPPPSLDDATGSVRDMPYARPTKNTGRLIPARRFSKACRGTSSLHFILCKQRFSFFSFFFRVGVLFRNTSVSLDAPRLPTADPTEKAPRLFVFFFVFPFVSPSFTTSCPTRARWHTDELPPLPLPPSSPAYTYTN